MGKFIVKPKKSFSKKKRPQQAAINKLLETNVGEEDIAATEVDANDLLKTKALSSTAASVLNTKSEIKQSKTLPQLEKQVWNGIEKGKDCFLSIGEALAEIQETKLYKGLDTETFEKYCKKTFGISVAGAYRYIECYQIEKTLSSPIGDRTGFPPLKLESHYRELGKVEGSTNQTKILEIFQEQNPESKITAKGLKEVVSKHYEKTSKKVSKKEIKQTMRVNERLRTFSSEDISVEGETFEIKSKEKDVADFLKRVKEAISAGGSVQIAYKNKRKPALK
jgi:hypothetical protein